MVKTAAYVPTEDAKTAIDGRQEPAGRPNSASRTAQTPSVGDIHKQDTKTPAIKLLTYADMVDMPQGDWTVEDVIPRRAKSVLYGPSNSFKSFHATDLGCSVSTGGTYHGNATRKMKVIYVANEGANGVGRKRIPAWMAAHGVPPEERGNIYLVTAQTILPNEPSRKSLIAAIRTIAAPNEEFFLIIDVLRGTMTGSENDDEAAHAWTSAAEILIKEGATLLTITHSPYSEDGRMRGHSHLWGSFDTRLQSEGDKEKRTSILKVERHKEHDSSGQWGFTLDEFEIEEHKGEFSLVPRLDDAAKPAKKMARMTKAAKIALAALHEAVANLGTIPPASNHIPSGVKCVTQDQWRDYFGRRYADSTKDAVRVAFKRGMEALTADNAIGCWTPHVWPVK